MSFFVKQGEAVALLGPNGAGKTTCFDIAVGLVKPDGGSISLADHDITKLKIHERARLGISYLTQEPSAFRQLSVSDNLRLVLELMNLSDREITEKSKYLLDSVIIHKFIK